MSSMVFSHSKTIHVNSKVGMKGSYVLVDSVWLISASYGTLV